MKMLKNFFVVLIVFLLICFGMCAPYIATKIQDKNTIGHVLFHKVPSVQLQTQETNNVLLTLKLMSEIDSTLDIPEALAVLTKEDALEIARSTLNKYKDAGVIEEYTELDTRVYVFLGQQNGVQERNCIFWNIHIRGIVNDKAFESTVSIDDVSGTVLGIYFTGKNWTSQEEKEHLLSRYAYTFLSELGLQESDAIDVSKLQKIYLDGEVCGFAYQFRDTSYGEITIEFYSNTANYTMYTAFPNNTMSQQTPGSSERIN